MPALDFPNAPTLGQTYPAPPVEGVPTYTWDGQKWLSSFALGNEMVKRAGDVMEGPLILDAAPTVPLEAATKAYVDAGNVDSVTKTYVDTQDAAIVTAANGAYQAKDPQLFAGVPVTKYTASYQIVASDAQKALVGTTNGLGFIIPTNATVPFPIGTVVTFVCWVGGTITLNAAAGANCYINIGGVISSFPRTVSNTGIVTMLKVDTDVWFGSGSGVT
jgi:hypothetical protein